MSRLRTIAAIPAGSWTKWVVVGFWVVVLVVAYPLSTRLMGAEKNDLKYWLPANAESTKVLDVQAQFQSPNVYAGVIVYVRPSGLTAADRAKAAADARRFAQIPGVVPCTVAGLIPSADGRAMQTILQVNLGSDLGRWMWWPSRLARTPDPAPAELGQERAAALVAGGTS